MRHPLSKVFITQKFGERPDVYRQFGMNGHNGLDYRVKFSDTPKGRRYVYPVMEGVVTEVKYSPNGYGHYVRLRHRGTEQTIYGHNTKIYVKVGQKVTENTTIALTGNTGFSSGAHLHLGWRPDKFNYNNGFKGYEDPEKLFKQLEDKTMAKKYRITGKLEDPITALTGAKDLDSKEGQLKAAEKLEDHMDEFYRLKELEKKVSKMEVVYKHAKGLVDILK